MEIYQCPNCNRTYSEFENVYYCRNCNYRLVNKKQLEEKNIKSTTPSNNTPKCPKCGCTNIQIVRRNWSFFAGFATNKTDRVCVNCNYKW